MEHSTVKEVVIIGAGIIGCTTAYYLTRHPKYSRDNTKITVLEASKHGPAAGASGKAGGLVAKWAYPKELVKVSFGEHVKLAHEHDGENLWGWRFVNCGSWEGVTDVTERRTAVTDKQGSARNRARVLPRDLSWIDAEKTDSYSPMADFADTAQVHPFLFTTSMMKLAQERGATLLKGRATRIVQADGHVQGVEFHDFEKPEPGLLNATHVILAAGAWSKELLPSLPIVGMRAHSVVVDIDPSVQVAPYVLFTEISSPGRPDHSSPEIYPRPDHTIYACGTGDSLPLPRTVDDVEVDETACQTIFEQVSSISPVFREGVVKKHQACYLPNVDTGGGPIIGEASGVARGLIIATGHTCWGICNAPGTALGVSEFVMDGKTRCANWAKLQPSHFLR